MPTFVSSLDLRNPIRFRVRRNMPSELKRHQLLLAGKVRIQEYLQEMTSGPISFSHWTSGLEGREFVGGCSPWQANPVGTPLTGTQNKWGISTKAPTWGWTPPVALPRAGRGGLTTNVLGHIFFEMSSLPFAVMTHWFFDTALISPFFLSPT